MIIFLVKFFSAYIILSLSYNLYLSYFNRNTPQNKVDNFTETVGYHTLKLSKVLNFPIKTSSHEEERSIKLIYQDRYIAKIVEGCNSISIIILFWAFIFAFSGKLKTTLIFGLFGSLIIYIINLIRIILLTKWLYEFPNYYDFLHKVVFPLIIYGTTMFLWVIWVTYLAKKEIKS